MQSKNLYTLCDVVKFTHHITRIKFRLTHRFDRWGYVPGEKVVWRETAFRRHPKALEKHYHALHALTLPVPSVP